MGLKRGGAAKACNVEEDRLCEVLGCISLRLTPDDSQALI